MTRWKSWLVVFCALVVICTTAVEASHFHSETLAAVPFSKPLPKKSNGTCLICNALHAPAILSAIVTVGVEISKRIEALPETPHSTSGLKIFDLSVRPPPNLA